MATTRFSVATPLALSCAVPKNALPVQLNAVASQKLIVPGVTGLPRPTTEAVMVTIVSGATVVAAAPLAESDSIVVLGATAGDTLYGTAIAALLKKLMSPEYVAVKLCCPTASVAMVNVAKPLLSAPAPIDTPLSRNVTVSPLVVAMPIANGDSTAVNVTGWPKALNVVLR